MTWQTRATQVVALCLQIDPNTPVVPNATLSTELAAVSRKLAATFPCIGSSAVADALTGDDAAFWGEGVGYTFAAAIRRCIAKKIPTGEVLEIKIDTTDFKFAAPPAMMGAKTTEEAWTDLAWESLRFVSCIALGLADLRAVSWFAAAGPRSALEAKGRYTTFNPLFNVMQDLLRTEQVFIQNESAWALWEFR